MKLTKEQKDELLQNKFVESVIVTVLDHIFTVAELQQFNRYIGDMAQSLVGQTKSVEFFVHEENHEALINSIEEHNDFGIYCTSLDEVHTEDAHYNFRIMVNAGEMIQNEAKLDYLIKETLQNINLSMTTMIDNICLLRSYQTAGESFIGKYNEFYAASIVEDEDIPPVDESSEASIETFTGDDEVTIGEPELHPHFTGNHEEFEVYEEQDSELES